MKVKLVLLVILFSVCSSANGQNVHAGLMGFAGIGLSIPTAEREFSKNYRPGLNLDAAGCYVLNKTYAVRLDLLYNSFSFKETDPGYKGRFISYSLIGGFLAGDFNRNTSMNAYGMIGLGVFINSEKITTDQLSISNSVANLGAGFGGGLNVKATEKVGMFTEIQYIFIFHQGIAKGYMPFKVGLTFRK